ncbi:MAG TPA: Stealth CR1 domain-containing protein [Noviherbaspirillum sp.]|jgi:hypothetical protein|uniref:Stealth CR1 domain-containing protein n=1 Tax=Noviherbaspirillum sp. TaxID=1926288 RepID=UPI002F93B943
MENGGKRYDVVYLWVDGADPDWRQRRSRAFAAWSARHPGLLAPYGNVEGRYRDNDELRFNLRALERYFPNHGHVYLVTDRQQPAWLRPSSGLTVIDHADLIPASARPVFDSGHIASYVHRIPWLSERFFLMNDDVFFGAPVDTAHWFGERTPVYVETAVVPAHERVQPHGSALVNAAILAREWMTARYPDYRHEPRVVAHAPRALSRSLLFELERQAPEVFALVRSTAFRSWRAPTVVSGLLLHWMAHCGLARFLPAPDGHCVQSGDSNALAAFLSLQKQLGRIPFFCINDTCDDAAAGDLRLRRVARILQQWLPLPSQFEADRQSRDPRVSGSATGMAA